MLTCTVTGESNVAKPRFMTNEETEEIEVLKQRIRKLTPRQQRLMASKWPRLDPQRRVTNNWLETLETFFSVMSPKTRRALRSHILKYYK